MLLIKIQKRLYDGSMGIFKSFISFFESLFHHSAADSKVRNELKKIENEVRLHSPVIYRNRSLVANVAETFVLLITHVKRIEEILSSTIKSNDAKKAGFYVSKLLMTNFNPEMRELYDDLFFDVRKEAVKDSKIREREFQKQEKQLSQFLQGLNSPEFEQINVVVAKLYQLCDVCRFNYLDAVKLFVPSFTVGASLENMEINNVPIENFESILLDLYYLIHDFQLTSSMAKAVIALAVLHSGADSVDQDEILEHLRKISYIFRHVLEPDVIKSLLLLIKKDPTFIPRGGSYKASVLNDFIEQTKKQYEADTKRIQLELQDEFLSSEIINLFGNQNLEVLDGYNMDYNIMIQGSGSEAFTWVTPIQILKTFLTRFFDDKIKAVLNDIVIEGFFCNLEYKSNFSKFVFSVTESLDHIKAFEQTFARNGVNDIVLLRSYFSDSFSNPEFATKLSVAVKQINETAKELVVEESSNIRNLFGYLKDLFEDAKLISPSNITNIKILLASSRNKEYATQLENQLVYWEHFISLMGNYIVFSETRT